jgi:putative ABC transport system ATP-binding protein
MTVIEARSLGYAVAGRQILRGVDLAVAAGERLAVMGPSGSGKTSLLALLAGLAVPTAGEVRLDGEPVAGIAKPSLGVALVLQRYGLVSLLSAAAESVEIALRAAGWSRSDARADARRALERVGLEAHLEQLVEELSGGQQQRTAVARALALRPRLLIADEPTAELDPASRAVVLARLLEVVEGGAALVLATHDSAVADRCDRVLYLHPGKPRATAIRPLRHRPRRRPGPTRSKLGPTPNRRSEGARAGRSPAESTAGNPGACCARSAGSVGASWQPTLHHSGPPPGRPAGPSSPEGAGPTTPAVAGATDAAWSRGCRRTGGRRYAGSWPSEPPGRPQKDRRRDVPTPTPRFR